MLQVRELCVHRGGKQVLHGVSLDITPGQITALVGANGAGKSTTVLAMGGVLPVSAGHVELTGTSTDGSTRVVLHNCRPEVVRVAGVAVVPEGHRVLGDLSVLDNLRAAASSLSPAVSLAAIDRVLAVFPELKEKLPALARTLSGGQKQMVCIAQALVVSPGYLIVDELSLGLAPTVVKRLAQVLEHAAESGVGVLLIEQFTTLALSLATQAYVLERGRIAFAGTAAALRDQPEILHNSYLATSATA